MLCNRATLIPVLVVVAATTGARGTAKHLLSLARSKRGSLSCCLWMRSPLLCTDRAAVPSAMNSVAAPIFQIRGVR